MVELMLVVAIISILAAVTIPIVTTALRREHLNSVLIEFSGWLEEISRNTERTGVACQVTLEPTALPGPVAQGQRMAQVTPATCASNPDFLLPNSAGNEPINVGTNLTADPPTWTYTPRGAINQTADFQVRLAINGSRPVRCVEISAILGLIRFGANNNGTSVTNTCTVGAI